MNIKKLGKEMLAVLLIGTAAITLAACGKSDTKETAAGADGAKKVITVAHTNYYVPYDYVNDKGESDGFEVAVMKEVAKKLPQYEFKFVPTSDDDLLIGVESGKYTVGTKGIWKTPAREKKYIFPKNYIGASVIGLVIRKDTADKIKDMESFAAYSGKLVPIAPQNAQYAVVEEYNKSHPDKQIKLVPSEAFKVSDAYTWVMEGRYDAYFEVELNYKNNVLNENGSYHQFADNVSYIRYKGIPTYPLFNKKEQKFADEYDKAIEELRAEGKITELENKYFGESLSNYIGDSDK
jgi:L-cystine transport system substrate-binding protein